MALIDSVLGIFKILIEQTGSACTGIVCCLVLPVVGEPYSPTTGHCRWKPGKPTHQWNCSSSVEPFKACVDASASMVVVTRSKYPVPTSR